MRRAGRALFYRTPGAAACSGTWAVAGTASRRRLLRRPLPRLPLPEEGLHIVRSPIVGTFYESPSPGSPPFVKPGDMVEAGQILCIVEAMKLMNEIESDVAGEIVKKLVANNAPIEYGQELFAIRPRSSHVGTAALGCPVESTLDEVFCRESPYGASLFRTAEGGCAHVVLPI